VGIAGCTEVADIAVDCIVVAGNLDFPTDLPDYHILLADPQLPLFTTLQLQLLDQHRSVEPFLYCYVNTSLRLTISERTHIDSPLAYLIISEGVFIHYCDS